MLCLGLAMRGLGVVLLAAIREPGAWTWREIIAGRRTEELLPGPVVRPTEI